jgi:glutamate:GABA antiporter
VAMFILGFIVFFFGRRSAAKVSQEDALAHLAVLELKDETK